MSRQYGKTAAELRLLGALVKNIKPGAKCGVIFVDKCVTISAEAHEEHHYGLTPHDYLKDDDEFAFIPEDLWETVCETLRSIKNAG